MLRHFFPILENGWHFTEGWANPTPLKFSSHLIRENILWFPRLSNKLHRQKNYMGIPLIAKGEDNSLFVVVD